MGKPTGFMEFGRLTPSERPPEERLADWEEMYEPLPEEELRRQGARCMDCGVPFCHTGREVAGRTSGCPINNLIPEWNDLVYRGLWREALDRLHRTNNFPEFTGRVCPAPCEGSCVLAINEPAVSIKSIENAIADRGWEEGWIVPEPPAWRTGKQVAVVGSGPAGLACAAQLNRAGHRVTVYERDDRIGGLLVYGIPAMKLDKEVVRRRVDLLAAEGIQFVPDTEIGVDIAASQLVEEFDAVVLCTGATRPRDLPVEGRELDGVHFAMEFLTSNTKSLLDSGHDDGRYLSAEDKHVIVIGGGDTGTDCVATAMRHGCRSLTQFEILPRPPETRAPDNPWPEWPNVYVLDYGQKEARARFGDDPRQYLLSTTHMVGDEEGRVRELHTTQVVWEPGEDGRRTARPLAGTEKVWPAELVLLALGYQGPERAILDELALEQDARSNIRADHGAYETNVPGVFAAGDARRGQSLVVWAIEEGRGAARAVDLHLMGRTELP
jgi:glutamate synthase (NADPH/NADH) small chain